MNAIGGGGQHDVTTGRVIVASGGEVEDIGMFRVCFLEDRGPPSVRPERVPVVFRPVDEIIAAREADSAAFIQSIPTPVAKTAALEIEDAHRVRKLVPFPLLGVGQHMAGLSKL